MKRKMRKKKCTGIRDRPTKSRFPGITLGYLTAMALLLGTAVMRLHQSRQMEQVLSDYEDEVEEYSQRMLDAMYEAAAAYNETLARTGSTKGYASLLNFGDDGLMGRITIPSIDVDLPVYHTTQSSVLKKGIGHLESSSLPIGGESTHAVLTGHCGQIGKRLFTDLDLVEIGDFFYIEIGDRVMVYEVVRIQVVLPDETESLSIVSGEDLCTLVTCTPYGVNSHRLLVTGRAADEYDFEAEPDRRILRLRDLLLPAAAVAETSLYLWMVKRDRRKRSRHMSGPAGSGHADEGRKNV